MLHHILKHISSVLSNTTGVVVMAVPDGAGSQTVVQGATRLPISCATAAEALVKKAAAARAVESTAMNAVSSRSHSVFTLYITGRHETSGQSLQGALNLVDLAGRWALLSCPAGHTASRPGCILSVLPQLLHNVIAATSAAHCRCCHNCCTLLLLPQLLHTMKACCTLLLLLLLPRLLPTVKACRTLPLLLLLLHIAAYTVQCCCKIPTWLSLTHLLCCAQLHMYCDWLHHGRCCNCFCRCVLD